MEGGCNKRMRRMAEERYVVVISKKKQAVNAHWAVFPISNAFAAINTFFPGNLFWHTYERVSQLLMCVCVRKGERERASILFCIWWFHNTFSGYYFCQRSMVGPYFPMRSEIFFIVWSCVIKLYLWQFLEERSPLERILFAFVGTWFPNIQRPF